MEKAYERVTTKHKPPNAAEDRSDEQEWKSKGMDNVSVYLK